MKKYFFRNFNLKFCKLGNHLKNNFEVLKIRRVSKIRKNFLHASFTSLLVLVFTISVLSFSSCDNLNQQNPQVQDYDIADFYGYTFQGTISASSGNTLTPALILYNENRCDWNMSTNGMEFNQFYYFSKKNSASNYTLYWYGGSKAAYASLQDESQADMVVQLGLNSQSEVVVLLTGDSLTGVSGMTNTRVSMQKTDAEKNTSAPEITINEDVNDVNSEIPKSALSEDWFEDSSTYEGSFDFMVGEDGALLKDHGKSDADGKTTPTVKITKSSSGKVVVSTPAMYYTETMNITSYDIADVEVKKDGDVYYLTKGSYTQEILQSSGKSITLNGSSVYGKYENGSLTLRLEFYPGKMPFPITQIFTSGTDDE